MVNITVSVPIEMKKKMDEFAIINWSEVARGAFTEQISKLELLKKLTTKSKATDKDIQGITAKIREGVWKRHEEKK
ncbi:hypothetical protein HY988_05445 [Candidatus Micrarchaeota archaeon]|nr:hypothetical protein [Candidatus Micrarchaeota archaeon]